MSDEFLEDSTIDPPLGIRTLEFRTAVEVESTVCQYNLVIMAILLAPC